MGLHNSIELLEPGFQTKVRRMFDLFRADVRMKELGVKAFLSRETLRELAVQMAYRTKSLNKLLLLKPDQRPAFINYIRELYLKAGMWNPTDDECLRESTQTLDSKHLTGQAIDVAPSLDGKNPWWGAPREVWELMGSIGKACGLIWGGDFKGLNDSPHFEEKV